MNLSMKSDDELRRLRDYASTSAQRKAARRELEARAASGQRDAKYLSRTGSLAADQRAGSRRDGAPQRDAAETVNR